MHFSGGPVFLGVGIVSGAVTDILRNQDSAGRQIYNPQDTGANIAAKATERLWKAFTPGAFDTAGRIIKAGAGDVIDSGRAYNLANELGGLAFGQRITEVNVEQALGFKASKYGRDSRDASTRIGPQSPASQVGFEPS